MLPFDNLGRKDKSNKLGCYPSRYLVNLWKKGDLVRLVEIPRGYAQQLYLGAFGLSKIVGDKTQRSYPPWQYYSLELLHGKDLRFLI